jgi:molybdate/tungstate transport system permease protein
MSNATRSLPVVGGAFGTATVAGAVLGVQLAAFLALDAVGHPTWYIPFALASAGALGYATARGGGVFRLATASLATVLLLTLALPLALFVLRQDLALVLEAVRNPEVHLMLLLTIYGPLLAALVATVFGVPLAYLLSRGFPGQSLVESLVDLPLVVPHSVAGVIILFGFGQNGLFPGVSVITKLEGMVLALVFVSAPFAVNAVREAFESIDPRLEMAARSHGASPFETFRRVHLPLASRGVLTGGVLAWARGVSEFGAVAVVAYTVYFAVPDIGESLATASPAFDTLVSYHAPVFIYKAYNGGGLDESGAVATVLLVMSALIFLLVRWLAYDRDTGGVL